MQSKKGYSIYRTFFFGILFTYTIEADTLKYNSYNNHGVVGLINMPTARSYDASSHGVTFYGGAPDQKITFSSNPFDWLEASFFYMSLDYRTDCRGNAFGQSFCQTYKDKGFNIKAKIKDEGRLPAIAIGINDIAGTGFYSAEYIVTSYGINNIDLHFGLGWGTLNGLENGINNPLSYISDKFRDRPDFYADKGGQFQPSRYFSGKKVSPFFGISYVLNNKTILKIEKDTTLIGQISPKFSLGAVQYKDPNTRYSFGVERSINTNFSISWNYERGNYSSLKFIYKNNPEKFHKKYKYQEAEVDINDNKYSKLIKNLEENGIGVNKILETSRSLGLELTQFIHSDLDMVEKIITQASRDAGITKPLKKDIKIANFRAISEIDKAFELNAQKIYEREKSRKINTSNGIKFRPFLASREEFFKGALLYENDTELIIKENLFFNLNLKYSLIDNFDDLTIPPVDTFPAQVRSDVKEYLRNIDKGFLLGRAQLDYHISPKNNHHLMFSAGILEDMFKGYGMEYLFFKQDSNYAFGVEFFKVKKRDYNWGFGSLDYENNTGSANFYYRNYGLIPFDMKISVGEYLAGDVGSTIEFSRTFTNGVQFGAFATFTDVSTEQFGEGTFDKGIFFNIPIYGNFINYTWRPLTKDPGAKLIRRNNLHDLLVRFRPLN